MTDRVRSAAELAAIRLGTEAEGVPLGEIATVAVRVVGDGTAFRIFENGRPAEGVLLRVYRAPGGNAVALARAVRQRVAALSARTSGVRLQVVSDRSAEVTRALAELISRRSRASFGTIVLRLALATGARRSR